MRKKAISFLENLQKRLLKIEKRTLSESNLLIKTYQVYYKYLSEKKWWEKAIEKGLEGKKLKDFELAINIYKSRLLFGLSILV